MSILQYKVITKAHSSTYVVKKSKFIAYAHPSSNLDQVQVVLNELRKQHHKANHHCYAFRIGLDGNLFRANDDGEPSGTAGRPILGQIDSKELVDIIVVVVRYFGGVKLGASGLISAYKKAAKQVLDECQIVTKKVTKEIKIGSDHQHINQLLSFAKVLGFELVHTSYDPRPVVLLKAPLDIFDQAVLELKAKILNMSTDQAKVTDASAVFHIFDE